MMATTTTGPGVGELLREWRLRRSLSQMELALGSAVSTRHLSFIETGRAKPSREMVLHLADRLDVPLRERNGMLLAAGFAPQYMRRGLDDEEMAPAREAIERLLAAHEPYPALVADRHWNLVTANSALGILLEGTDPALIEDGNGLRITLHPDGMAPRIVNLTEWSAHLLHRLRRRAAITGDASLLELHDELAEYPGVCAEHPADDGVGNEIALNLRLGTNRGELALLCTQTAFGTAVDITLAELAVEAFYPADPQTARALA